MPISTPKAIFFGLLTWLVPFVVSVPFHARDGRLVILAGIFKGLMVVVGAAVGAWLLVRVFRCGPSARWAGIAVGLPWMAINLALDLVALVPLAKMGLSSYFGEIGLRYLVIPIMAVAIATVARDAGGPGVAAGPGIDLDRPTPYDPKTAKSIRRQAGLP